MSKTVILEKDVAGLACCTLVFIVRALRATLLALNTDEVFCNGDVKFSGARGALSKTLFISFVEFQSCSTLRALILVEGVAGSAGRVTLFARL